MGGVETLPIDADPLDPSPQETVVATTATEGSDSVCSECGEAIEPNPVRLTINESEWTHEDLLVAASIISTIVALGVLWIQLRRAG